MQAPVQNSPSPTLVVNWLQELKQTRGTSARGFSRSRLGLSLLPDAILNQQLGIDIAGHEDTAIDHHESGSVSDWWTPSSTVFPFLGSKATSCPNFGRPYMTPFATTSRPGLLVRRAPQFSARGRVESQEAIRPIGGVRYKARRLQRQTSPPLRCRGSVSRYSFPSRRQRHR